jgi:UDP-glucose 4-epimerase
MSTLVTGSAGFIASHLIPILERQEHVVHGVDIKTNKKNDLVKLSNATRIAKSTSPEFLFHLAGSGEQINSTDSYAALAEGNLLAYVNILQSAIEQGLRHVCLISGVEAYGFNAGTRNENAALQPASMYGAMKAAMEHATDAICTDNRITYTICRVHDIYGPGFSISVPGTTQINEWIRRVQQGDSLYLINEGHQLRQPTYITDAVEAIAAIGCHPLARNKAINIGHNHAYRMADIARLIGLHCGGKGYELEYLENKSREIIDTRVSHTQAEQVFKQHCQTTFNVGLEHTWNWIQEFHGNTNNSIKQKKTQKAKV